MTTSDIAGLSERLEAMTAFAKELSDTLLSIRPLGGSECFVKRCGAYYADPNYFKGFIKRESDNRHEAMKCLVRERDRALRAEQQRDEAVTALDRLASFSISGVHARTGKLSDVCKAWVDHKKDALAVIRRLASGPEGGSVEMEGK